MNARTEGRIAHRPGEHEVRGQVRRASLVMRVYDTRLRSPEFTVIGRHPADLEV
jgi:hypothetical protein